MATPDHSADQATAAKSTLESIQIRGFRSLADVRLDALPNVTVLIGANGSGKSNLFRFFEMCSWMLRSGKLAEFVARQGGADDQLFGGREVTPLIEANISIRTGKGRNDYRFSLAWAQPDRLIFLDESFRFSRAGFPTEADWQQLGSAHSEARIVDAAQDRYPGVNPKTAHTIRRLLNSCVVYQFHDTSERSRFKQLWDVDDNRQLRSDGGNLAAVLLRLEHEDPRRYELICRQIARILPGFDCFDLVEQYGKVALRWQRKGVGKTYGAHLTSDGSLRFFALVTLLNLPRKMMPDVVLLDEPELGLHPAAVELIGHMIAKVSHDRQVDPQVILATQSPALVDLFDLEQIAVLDLDDGRTICRQLDRDEYRVWLEDDYTAGELWNMNVLEGRP